MNHWTQLTLTRRAQVPDRPAAVWKISMYSKIAFESSFLAARDWIVTALNCRRDCCSQGSRDVLTPRGPAPSPEPKGTSGAASG